MTRLRNVLAMLRGQLWIVPTLISALALVLAFAMLTFGSVLIEPRGTPLWWLYSGDADTARGLLSSLLSGLMTMTSLVVSVTFVILTLAASQLGPRLTGFFMADRQIQAVLGLFLGTILYLLVVLRSLDKALGREGVPHIAVTVGSLLTVVCLFALLFYVHKIARSIIADTVIEKVARQFQGNIRAILPDDEETRRANAAQNAQPMQLSGAATVALERAGYIQTIDYAALVEMATTRSLLLQVNVRAGYFVLPRGDHVLVSPPDSLDNALRETIRDAFVIAAERSPAQDLEFSIRQLVEISLRALSPGINDPFTAVAALDHLGAGMAEILRRPQQPGVYRDEAGAVRVIVKRSDPDGLIRAAFDPIRHASGNSPTLLVRLADMIGQLAPILNAESREPALRQLALLEQTTEGSPLAEGDRDAVMVHIQTARAAVSAAGIRRPKCGFPPARSAANAPP